MKPPLRLGLGLSLGLRLGVGLGLGLGLGLWLGLPLLRRHERRVCRHVMHRAVAGRSRPAEPLCAHGRGVRSHQRAWGVVADPAVQVDDDPQALGADHRRRRRRG